QLFEMPDGQVICSGMVDKIGEKGGKLTYEFKGEKTVIDKDFADHHAALQLVADTLTNSKNGAIQSPDEIDAVGHRVVHGGEQFKATTLIDNEVKRKIKQLFSLAPL